MDMLLARAVPDAPAAERIECAPGQGEEATYCVVFAEPLTEMVINSINAYLSGHPGISGAAAVKDDARSVLVRCVNTDADFETLAWLQRSAVPSVPLTGVAQLCVKARPVMARVALVGDVPMVMRAQLLRQFGRLSGVATASYYSEVNEIRVVFSGEPPTNRTEEETLASLFGLQRIAAMTVVIDQETVPDKPEESGGAHGQHD